MRTETDRAVDDHPLGIHRDPPPQGRAGRGAPGLERLRDSAQVLRRPLLETIRVNAGIGDDGHHLPGAERGRVQVEPASVAGEREPDRRDQAMIRLRMERGTQHGAIGNERRERDRERRTARDLRRAGGRGQSRRGRRLADDRGAAACRQEAGRRQQEDPGAAAGHRGKPPQDGLRPGPVPGTGPAGRTSSVGIGADCNRSSWKAKTNVPGPPNASLAGPRATFAGGSKRHGLPQEWASRSRKPPSTTSEAPVM